jgi:hypothetical protein
MDVALKLVEKIDWSGFVSHVGSAAGVGDALMRLLVAPDAVSARDAWWGMRGGGSRTWSLPRTTSSAWQSRQSMCCSLGERVIPRRM